MAALDLSIVIPTLNAAGSLGRCLGAVTSAPERGVNREVIVADGGSQDGTVDMARAMGAKVISSAPGRGGQLVAGARAAGGHWLLFLHGDTALGPGWARAAADFMGAEENARRAAYFRFVLDDKAPAARRLERLVAWRCRFLALPYGDQGLLLSRDFYEELGGFPPLPLMEDVALVRRIGRRRLVALDVHAVTSAARYRRGGYLWRPLRNLGCLVLYFMNCPPRLIARLYGS
ncbi:MAG: TIGR04283 family arsenosugar biosynthesis glycosyltransferase [Alphaproteobacteria bacterium]|nr:TIGR04283 family arsenosugar biosynthesis glycosyltransferase [Alphaproteobacteria bacterium]